MADVKSTNFEIKSNADLLKMADSLFADIENKGKRNKLKRKYLFAMRNKYGAFE